MAEGGASLGFDSSSLDHRGARDKDSLFHMSDASKSAARENPHIGIMVNWPMALQVDFL